jgi:hypothetical protein
VYRINAAAQIVGAHTDAAFVSRAFVATPTVSPEPGTVALLAVGLGALEARVRTRPRRRA